MQEYQKLLFLGTSIKKVKSIRQFHMWSTFGRNCATHKCERVVTEVTLVSVCLMLSEESKHVPASEIREIYLHLRAREV